MVNLGITLLLLLQGSLLVWLYWQLRCFAKQQSSLEALTPMSDADCPAVSLIIPIHNEARELKATLTRLCQLDYPNYDIIAVNDRSTDATAMILQCLSTQMTNLHVITIDTLPTGWLGKPHALATGVTQSQHDYLIFADADVHFAPDLLKKAMALMLGEQLDHLTLSPRLHCQSVGLRCVLPLQVALMTVALQPWKMHDKTSSLSIGIGAFNLVKHKALVDSGGFSSLALNPIDDVGLAKQLKAHGYRQGYATAGDLLSLSWYHSLAALVVGLEKNTFAFFRYRLSLAFSACLALVLFVFFPWVILFLGSWLLKGFAALMILLSFKFLDTVNQTQRFPRWSALLYPLTSLFCVYITLRSVLRVWLHGGISWGGQFFTLKTLRNFAGNDH